MPILAIIVILRLAACCFEAPEIGQTLNDAGIWLGTHFTYPQKSAISGIIQIFHLSDHFLSFFSFTIIQEILDIDFIRWGARQNL